MASSQSWKKDDNLKNRQHFNISKSFYNINKNARFMSTFVYRKSIVNLKAVIKTTTVPKINNGNVINSWVVMGFDIWNYRIIYRLCGT